MEDMGLKLTTVVVRHLLGGLVMFGLALLGLIGSPNRGYSPPPASHPPSPPAHPYNVSSVILQAL